MCYACPSWQWNRERLRFLVILERLKKEKKGETKQHGQLKPKRCFCHLHLQSDTEKRRKCRGKKMTGEKRLITSFFYLQGVWATSSEKQGWGASWSSGPSVSVAGESTGRAWRGEPCTCSRYPRPRPPPRCHTSTREVRGRADSRVISLHPKGTGYPKGDTGLLMSRRRDVSLHYRKRPEGKFMTREEFTRGEA